MAETEADISKSLAARSDKKRGREKTKIVGIGINVRLPADVIEFEGERIIPETDTTPDDVVIKNLGPGVDIVKPAKPSKIVLRERGYKIRRGSKDPLLPG